MRNLCLWIGGVLIAVLLSGCETPRGPATAGTESLPVTQRARPGWVKGLQLTEGMSQEAVLTAIGEPDRKLFGLYEGVAAELWVYGEIVRDTQSVDLIPMEDVDVIDAVMATPRTIQRPVYGDTSLDTVRVTQLIFVESSLSSWNHH